VIQRLVLVETICSVDFDAEKVVLQPRLSIWIKILGGCCFYPQPVVCTLTFTQAHCSSAICWLQLAGDGSCQTARSQAKGELQWRKAGAKRGQASNHHPATGGLPLLVPARPFPSHFPHVMSYLSSDGSYPHGKYVMGSERFGWIYELV